MKPCSINRKHIALLAVRALDSHRERSLNAHIETCEGCRNYLEGMSNLTKKLGSAAEQESNLQASEEFHQDLVRRLKTDAPTPMWRNLLAFFRLSEWEWRWALPAFGVAALALVMLPFVLKRPVISPPPPAGTSKFVAPGLKNNLDPTISNYQLAANRSLEKLDELLTSQESRNPSSVRVYTAAGLSRADLPE